MTKSVENAKRFIEAAGKDQALQSRFRAARDPAELARLAIQAGSERGLPFTAEELLASLPHSGAGGGELSDDQLEGVAGGLAAGASPSQIAPLESFLRTLSPRELRELSSKA